MDVSLDPGVLVMLALAAGLYLRAVTRLRGRGWRVGRWQQASWWAGLALMALGLLSPVDVYAEDLLSAHMAQHLLIAELGAPLILVGIRTPVLQWLLPRPVLVPLARMHWLRTVSRVLRKPLVALPLFVGVLYFWHFRFAFVAALEDPFVHALQHASFVGASLLVWWPALQPEKGRMPGELWKIGHMTSARLASMFLGMAFVFAGTPVYAAFYGERAREHGLSPLEDQQLAGGMMMVLDILIIVFVLALFFWRAASDHDRAERRRGSEEQRTAASVSRT